MHGTRDPDPALERSVHAVLRSLPPRRAPQDLADRVLMEVQRRATMPLPWWRRQVTHWPRAARLGFALVAASLVLVSLLGSAQLTRLARPAPWVAIQAHAAIVFWHTLSALLAVVVGALPMQWLEAAAVLAAVAYLFLFGVGAAAWRLLYLQR